MRKSFRYRLLFYFGGFLFATASYIFGVWAYGLESKSWGDVSLYQSLIQDLSYSMNAHWPTISAWAFVCICISAYIGFLLDSEVNFRKMAELRANIDGVTEIYNHRHFQERLESEIKRAERFGRHLSLIMLDLDYFKTYNDSWGHQDGDKALKWFAGVCRESIRNIDILARYGGEEFVVILPETGPAEALEVAERIRKTVEKTSSRVLGKNRSITASAGVAVFPDHATEKHALILCADAALYSAKQQGRNRSLIYDENCAVLHRVSTSHVGALLAADDNTAALEALAAVIDARDNYSKGHSRSVMEISLALGEQIGMTQEELETLRTASLLHDLGKIGMPEEMLDKKFFDAEERTRIQTHASLGSQILRRVQQMGAILPGVRHHHERFDGTGYPSGLSGTNIPLIARIIAIADSYDAMTNNRPYRPALSRAEAFEEMKKCAGKQFDPELVGAFINMMNETRDKAA
ncbi:MAG: diguanylate cyclase [Armatimonadota bacterium]